MNNSSESLNKSDITSKSLEAVIRIGLVVLLLAWCFQIILPFVVPTTWGVIIAVAIFPLYDRAQRVLGGRQGLTATLFTLIALAILITPTLMISASFVETSRYLLQHLDQGTLSVPPPKPAVRDWPLLGEKIYLIWSHASENLEDTLKEYAPQVKRAGQVFFSAAAGVGSGVLQFVIAIIISGVLLTKAEPAYRFTLRFFKRLSGAKNGLLFTNLARLTIRSVAQGVIGIALIQAVLISVGLYLMAIPGWGAWAVLVLIFAVAQLPVLLLMLPIIAYVFSAHDTVASIVFTIWTVLVSISDGFLKPLFLGRGLNTPTLVILLGAIGGMLLSGILGLFVGAIVLSLGYELFTAWIDKEPASD